jgi:RNA polymerase sigma-70 factor, ECF subfamily
VKEDADSTLVGRCRGGDRRACEQLVLRYQKPVYNAALRLLRNPEDARDVAQTAFLKAFEHLADYDPRFRFYSWIYRIAVNEALDTLGSRRPCEEIRDDEADEAAGPERLVEGEQIGRAIEDALMRIKPELRTVIVLRHLLHLSYHDMGETLQLPEKTVKSRLHDARQVLRQALLQRGTVCGG